MTIREAGFSADGVTREPVHTRCIEFECFRRSDGLFEVVGHLTDRKPYDFTPSCSSRVIPANDPVHRMGVRVLLDIDLVVRAVDTYVNAFPYRECSGGGAALQALVGLRVGTGWRREVGKRLPPADTCTHLREILIPLATAAIQGVNPFRAKGLLDGVGPEGKPVKVDSCYAYGSSREIVKQYWPEFHVPANT
ncbi:DUF2889 domain-containing protein [Paraburkholderia sp. A3BS-1L]|uniref:DUF2889 domain-containing protein n=1 Tax=Paraburkholderia sp. A3BS-1L TaxID=3028375 RepID=UPI003DA9276D